MIRHPSEWSQKALGRAILAMRCLTVVLFVVLILTLLAAKPAEAQWPGPAPWPEESIEETIAIIQAAYANCNTMTGVQYSNCMMAAEEACEDIGDLADAAYYIFVDTFDYNYLALYYYWSQAYSVCSSYHP